MLREEIRDLRLCLRSADKELAETKQELKITKTHRDTKLSDLHTRVLIIITVEPLMVDTPNKGHNRNNLSNKGRFFRSQMFTF